MKGLQPLRYALLSPSGTLTPVMTQKLAFTHATATRPAGIHFYVAVCKSGSGPSVLNLIRIDAPTSIMEKAMTNPQLPDVSEYALAAVAERDCFLADVKTLVEDVLSRYYIMPAATPGGTSPIQSWILLRHAA